MFKIEFSHFKIVLLPKDQVWLALENSREKIDFSASLFAIISVYTIIETVKIVFTIPLCVYIYFSVSKGRRNEYTARRND